LIFTMAAHITLYRGKYKVVTSDAIFALIDVVVMRRRRGFVDQILSFWAQFAF